METLLTRDELTAEKRTLIDSLKGSNHDEIMPLLRANEAAIKELDKITLLKNINSKYSRLRDMALQAYECEQPNEDITTNDGSFHKVKVKKYPKIEALKYGRATFENNKLTRLTINGEKFNMFREQYEYNNPTVYTRPETFNEFLALNSIPESDITIEQYNAMAERLNVLNDKLRKDIKEYENGLKMLKISSLNYWGLASQHNVNLYEYLPTVR